MVWNKIARRTVLVGGIGVLGGLAGGELVRPRAYIEATAKDVTEKLEFELQQIKGEAARNSVDDLVENLEKQSRGNLQNLSEEHREIFNTYSAIAEAYKARDKTFLQHLQLTAKNAGRVGTGVMGTVKNIITVIPGVEAAIDAYAKAMETVTGGGRDIEALRKSHLKAIEQRADYKELNNWERELNRTISYLHNEYIMNKDRSLSEFKTALSVMKKAGIQYQNDIKKLQDTLNESGNPDHIKNYKPYLKIVKERVPALLDKEAAALGYTTIERERQAVYDNRIWSGRITGFAVTTGLALAYGILTSLRSKPKQ